MSSKVENGIQSTMERANIQNAFYEGRGSVWEYEAWPHESQRKQIGGIEKDNTDSKIKQTRLFPFMAFRTRRKHKQGSEMDTSITDIKQTRHFPFASFRKGWKTWANRTTWHGMNTVFDSQTMVIRRIAWICIQIFLVYILVGGIFAQISRYLSYKTLTQESIRYEESLSFPAVTICNFNRIHNDTVTDPRDREILRQLYMYYPSNSSVLLKYPGEEYARNVSLRKIFTHSAMTVEEMFLHCIWEGVPIVPCKSYLIGRFRDTYYCHTFNSNNTFTTRMPGSEHALMLIMWVNQEKYFITDSATAGFKVVVHDQSQEPDIKQAIAIGPGFSHYLSIKKQEHIYMPSPVQAFDNMECIDTTADTFKHLLKYSEHYSYYACRTECWNDFVYQQCGCIGPSDIGNQTECDPFKIIECYNGAFLQFASESDFERCSCPLPCRFTSYKTRLSSTYYPNSNFFEQLFGASLESESRSFPFDISTIRDNVMLLRVFYDSKIVTKHEQVLEFNYEDVFSSVGGYMGLFIGASISTILEFVEHIFASFIRCFMPEKT